MIYTECILALIQGTTRLRLDPPWMIGPFPKHLKRILKGLTRFVL